MLPDINIHHLKYFHDSSMLGSISEAARKNRVSQPAVSQAIKKLETSLSSKLCHHSRHKFELTFEGKVVLREAVKVFSAIMQLQTALGETKKKPIYPVQFATTNSLGLSLLPRMLTEVKRDHSHLDVQYTMGGLSQIKALLKQGIIDFALVIGSASFNQYRRYVVGKGSFGIYTNGSNSDKIFAEGLFIEEYGGLQVDSLLKQFQQETKKNCPIAGQLSNWEIIARTISEYSGFGIIPDFLLKNKCYSTLKVAFPNVRQEYEIWAITEKSKFSPSAEVVLSILQST